MVKRAVVCCLFVMWYGAYAVAAAPTKAERDYQALMKQYRQWSQSQPRGKRTIATKPIKMSPQAKALLRGLATYSNTYRRSPRRYDAAYKLAKLLYDHNRFGQALVIFDRVIRKQSRRKIAVYAAQFTLDIYNSELLGPKGPSFELPKPLSFLTLRRSLHKKRLPLVSDLPLHVHSLPGVPPEQTTPFQSPLSN